MALSQTDLYVTSISSSNGSIAFSCMHQDGQLLMLAELMTSIFPMHVKVATPEYKVVTIQLLRSGKSLMAWNCICILVDGI